jgi:hypothetical protein
LSRADPPGTATDGAVRVYASTVQHAIQDQFVDGVELNEIDLTADRNSNSTIKEPVPFMPRPPNLIRDI